MTSPKTSARLVQIVEKKHKRILLKLSGESLGSGGAGGGIDIAEVRKIAESCKQIFLMGKDIAIVVGGGNIVRGSEISKYGLGRATADYMGMLATIINALALQDVLESIDVPTRVMSAVSTHQCAEPYIRRRAIRHLEKRRIVILAGGTGNPYFTTDTCATLRAQELGCHILLKATKVDGVYSADPRKDPKATRYDHLTYKDVFNQELGVMDATAITMAMEHDLPILVFDFKKPGNFARAVSGEGIGTLISRAPDA